MKSTKIKISVILGIMIMLMSGLFVVPTQAGPLQSFLADPTSYWDDDSIDVAVNWSESEQTVDFDLWYWDDDCSVVGTWDVGRKEATESISSGGDMLTYAPEGDSAGDVDYGYDVGVSIDYDEDYYYEVRYKVENTNADNWQVYFVDNDYDGVGSLDTPYIGMGELAENTDWTVVRKNLSDGFMSGVFGSKIKTVAIRSSLSDGVDVDFYLDYIVIGAWDSTLDVGVPIELGDIQTVETMISLDELGTSEVTFGLYDNLTCSNVGCTVNATGVTLDGDFKAVDDLLRLEFLVNDISMSWMIAAYDENRTYIGLEQGYDNRAGNNWFVVKSLNYDGNMTMYFLSGSTDYTSVRTRPYAYIPWDKQVTTDDEDVDQFLYNFEIVDIDDDVNHDVSYVKNFTMFQWVRVVQRFFAVKDLGTGDIDAGGHGDDGYYFIFTVYNETGNEDYEIIFKLFTYDNTVSGGLKIDSGITIKKDGVTQYSWDEQDSNTWSENNDMIAHIGVWRSLEGHLGVMWCSDQYIYDNTRADADIEDHTTWMSDEPVDSWMNCTLELRYDVVTTTTGNAELWEYFAYEAMEYVEFMDHGVAQLHFSSTWWESGRLWHIGDPGEDWEFEVEEDTYDDDFILFDEEPSPVWDPFGWVIYHIGLLIMGAINALMVSIWVGLFPFIGRIIEEAGLWMGLQVLHSLNLVGYTTFGLFDLGTDIIAFVGSIFSLITGMITILVWFVTTFGFLIELVIIYLPWASGMITEYGYMVPMGVLAHICIVYNSKGFDAAVGVFVGYAKILIGIFQVFWALISFAVNVVINLIPLT